MRAATEPSVVEGFDNNNGEKEKKKKRRSNRRSKQNPTSSASSSGTPFPSLSASIFLLAIFDFINYSSVGLASFFFF